MVNEINFKNWEKQVPYEQNLTIKWDPDSSPKAWEHYQTYYTVQHWPLLKLYGYDDFAASDKLLTKANRKKIKALYSPQIEESCSSRDCDICSSRKRKGKILRLRLRGETDFYFRENTPSEKKIDKYKKLQKIIQNTQQGKSEYAMKLLEKCKNMHYSLLNFSLMQSVGNMQGVKSKGLCCNGKYEWLDRLDTFVYHLDMYYKNRIDNYKEDDNAILNCAAGNKECLKIYLDTFKDVYDYCDKVYFIKIKDNERYDSDFVQRLIKSGKKILSSCDDVIEYMELAVEFWRKKQEYFESQKNINK